MYLISILEHGYSKFKIVLDHKVNKIYVESRCASCEKVFKNPKSLKEHVKTNHLIEQWNKNEINCKKCDEKMDFDELDSHIKEKHCEKTNVIPQNDKKTVEENLIICKKCDLKMNFEDLDSHIKEKHSEISKNQNEENSKNFENSKKSAISNKDVEKNVPILVNCNKCSEKMKIEDLNSHIKEKHSDNENPKTTLDFTKFKCPECNFYSSNTTGISNHLEE